MTFGHFDNFNFFQKICILKITKIGPKLPIYGENLNSEHTFVSSTFKVGEIKVCLEFGFFLIQICLYPICHFSIFWHILYLNEITDIL